MEDKEKLTDQDRVDIRQLQPDIKSLKVDPPLLENLRRLAPHRVSFQAVSYQELYQQYCESRHATPPFDIELNVCAKNSDYDYADYPGHIMCFRVTCPDGKQLLVAVNLYDLTPNLYQIVQPPKQQSTGSKLENFQEEIVVLIKDVIWKNHAQATR